MTVEDAMVFCSDPRSCGRMLGSEWAFFFTSLHNLLTNSPHVSYSRRQMVDDGRYDWLLEELGCVTVPLDDPRIPPGLIRTRPGDDVRP